MNDNYIIISTLIVLFICALFFLTFEKKKPSPRDLMPIIIICVISSLGRIIFSFIPQFQPVTALVIIMGICFGGQTGFLTGALCALVSNIILGQGLWTPWQMLAWGIIGAIPALFKHTDFSRNTRFIAIYGFFSAFIYSMITDLYTIATLGVSPISPMAQTIFVTGMLFNIGHAIGNVIFLFLLFQPLQRKFVRLQTKYGILPKRY